MKSTSRAIQRVQGGPSVDGRGSSASWGHQEGPGGAPAPSDLVPSARALSKNPVAAYLAGLSESSRRTMLKALNVVAETLSSGKINQAEHLAWWKVEFQHSAAVRSALAAKYAPATARRMLAALKGVLKACWRLQLVSAENYHRAADIAPIRGEALPRGRAISSGELRSLFETCAAERGPSGSRDSALLGTLYACGLRRAEAAALRVDSWTESTGEIRVLKAKGGRQRVVFSAQGARDALTAWLRVRGTTAGPLFCRVSKGALGHVTPEAGLTPQAIYAVVLRRARQSGVNRIAPHDFRRAHISDMLDRGADLVTISRLVAHASPMTTARYDVRGHLAQRKAAELLHVPFVLKQPGSPSQL